MVFDKAWFIQHQQLLLLFANTSLGRSVLCIDGDRSDVKKYKIRAIFPDAILWTEDGKRVKAEFRTHDKFSKRLYYNYKILWWVFHYWDMLIANKIAKRLNLGFDSTGDLFPASGANSPADGYVERNLGVVAGESLATLIAGAGTGNSETSSADVVARLTGGTSTDLFRRVVRGGFGFDTSPIPDTATIDTVTFSLSPTGKGNTIGSDDLHVCGFTPANGADFANTDYGNFGGTSFGSISYASWTADGGYDDIVLNSSGKSNINKSGNTFFGTRMGWDINGTFTGSWSSNGDSNFQAIYADNTGTSRDPKIVVEYTPVSSVNHYFMLLGLGS